MKTLRKTDSVESVTRSPTLN